MQSLVNQNPNGCSDHQTQQFNDLLDHYLHPPPQLLLPDMPEILDYADYDLISQDGSHLLTDPPNEEEEPPQFQFLNLENQEEEEEEAMAPPQEQEEEYEELDIVEDSDEEEHTIPKSRANRELRSLGVITRTSIPRELRNLNTSYNPILTDPVNITLTSDPGEPKTMKEAVIGPDRDKWIDANKKEITKFTSIGVWKPVSRKKVVEEMMRKLISIKWIFKKKTEQDNSIRHNALVVSIGFMQIPGVDYT
jgi:hypothetical protein